MMKVIAILPVLAFLACARHAEAEDIVGTAKQSPEISTFVAAVNTAGLAHLLSENGPYTVFAPSDSAFKALSPDERESLLSDKEQATKVVSDHVIRGSLTVAEIKPGTVRTIDGSTVRLESDNGLVKVENASVIQSDMRADNGVIHVVDAVVKPRN